MHRLVIALTSLITLVGVGVVAFYVLVAGLATDRAAGLAPASSAFYATAYLQPSAGQRAQLASIMSRLPGFEDTAALDTKIDELAQRFFGEAGIDYRSDVKPWLGNQVSVAAGAFDASGEPAELLVIADVKDAAAAAAGLESLLPGEASPSQETYQGLTLTTYDEGAYAIIDGMLVAGETVDRVRVAVDVAQDRSEALTDVAAFTDAMRTLPPDHLAALWVDLQQVAALAPVDADAAADMAGFSTFAMALLAEEAGFRVVGQLPVDPESAGAAVRDALAAGAAAPQVTGAMPADTELSFVMFNLRAALERTEQELEEQSPDVADTIDQLRALAGFGLGINIDNDLLPLLDGEVGLALTGIGAGTPGGVLVLRPSDPTAGAAALDRVVEALESRGSSAERTQVAGSELVTIDVPEIGGVAWAVAGETIFLGLTPDDVTAALEAQASGTTLAAADAYRSAFGAAVRGGTELFIDLGALVPLILDEAGDELPPEARDILDHVEAFAMTTPARADRFEFHAMLTIR